MRRRWKIGIATLVVVAGAAGVGWLAASGWTVAHVQGAFHRLTGPHKSDEHATSGEPPVETAPRTPWDGSVGITPRQAEAIGLKTASVQAQTEPTGLELIATTAYNPNTLTVIRPPFDLRVDNVYKGVGDTVRQGDPLLDVFSNVLAEAKTVLEKEFSEWQHDLRLLESRKELFDRGSITRQAWADIVNDEAKSKLEYRFARDKLQVFGLTEEEIERSRDEDGPQKAKMTIRARTEGVVIKREVVPHNLYQPEDRLLVIAPLERLWVQVSVPEGDAHKVRIGQKLRIIFPYNLQELPAEVEQIDNQIDPTTRSVHFRTSIPNDGKYQAGMYVKATLFLPPEPKQTVVPREALVTTDGSNYVFVEEADQPGRFARRRVQVAEELRHEAHLRDGVKPGEVVATRGSLILAQMAEDAASQ